MASPFDEHEAQGEPIAEAGEFDPETGWHGRPAWAEIDLDAVAENVRRMKRLVGDTAIMAVVKADGYGLGAVEIAGAAMEGGATWLGVACADEGVELRAAEFTCPILILGPPAAGEIPKIVGANLITTVHNLEIARALSRYAAEQGKVAVVHLKLDTGLNRFGHRPEGFVEFAREVAALPALRLEGLFTHFAVADQPDDPFTLQQIEILEAQRRALAEAGIEFSVVHAGNSAGGMGFARARNDLVRMGISLSGEYPSDQVDHSIGLIPAVTLKARIMRLWQMEAGETAGYGRTYRAASRRSVALVPFGYADGYPRAASNKTQVLVRGRRCPVIGRVSMDQMVVDVTNAPGAQEGDEAVLAGEQAGERVGLAEIAAAAGTISYELLTHLGRRLPRLYLKGGRVAAARTLLGFRQTERH